MYVDTLIGDGAGRKLNSVEKDTISTYFVTFDFVATFLRRTPRVTIPLVTSLCGRTKWEREYAIRKYFSYALLRSTRVTSDGSLELS